MVKIIYRGDISPCRIRAYSTIIDMWTRGEVKDLDEKVAKKILENKDFSLASGSKLVEEKKEEETVEDDDLDLNNDGVVDSKDASIAGKVLSKSRKK